MGEDDQNTNTLSNISPYKIRFRVLYVKIAVQATVRAIIIKGYIVFLANISIPG